MSKTGIKKLIAFFGDDLQGEDSVFLRKRLRDGFTLLPLDTSAIGLAARAGATYTLVDDWLDERSLVNARERAAEFELKWFDAVQDEFISEGICWPDLDREAMYWYWQDITLADALAETFVECGIQKLITFQKRRLRPALYYCPSDVISQVWKGKLRNKSIVLEVQEKWSLAFTCFQHISKRIAWIEKIASSQSKWIRKSAPSVANKVVLALNQDEMTRFNPIVHQLLKNFPQKVAAVILSPHWIRSRSISESWPIPMVRNPSLPSPDLDLQGKFLGGYLKALKASRNQPLGNFLASNETHFRFYCLVRWPLLVAEFRLWMALWREARPKAILVSSLEDGESQLPTLAANRLDVPTIAIPHGGFSPRPARVLVADYLLCNNSIQKNIYERAGVKVEHLVSCRDIVAENEYPVVSFIKTGFEVGLRLLALTNPIGTGCLAQRILPRAQMKALESLANPPGTIGQHISLKIKVHPGFPDLELLDVIGGGLRGKVLPPYSDLSLALSQSDLVVSINYCGSALIHALCAEKPVVFFWTDPLMGKVEPSLHTDLITTAGMLVHTGEDFWDCVGKFITDQSYADRLKQKACDFFRERLSDKNFPNISDILENILCKINN